MRSGIIAAAFAATVLAVPMEKRDVVTDTAVQVVYETAFVTVTDGAAPAATEATAGHWGHGAPHWWGGKGHKSKAKTTVVATTAPAYTATWAPAPTTSSVQSSPPPASTESSSPQPTGSYQSMVINQHNAHRANHSASNIQWDDTLAANAAKVAASCVYAHNTEIGGIPQGQNIAAGVDASQIDRIITNMFYDGEVTWFDGLYGEAQPDMTNFEHWGHFSQIVWKGTTHVGCYTQQCSTLQNVGSDVPPVFTVCNYSPPGNYANEYGDNIGRPLGDPSIVISS